MFHIPQEQNDEYFGQTLSDDQISGKLFTLINTFSTHVY
jgi:hypothetical protein